MPPKRDRYFQQTFDAWRKHGMSVQEARTLSNRGVRIRSATGKRIWRSREAAIKVDRKDNNTTRLGAIRRILENIRQGGQLDKNTAKIMTLGFTGIRSRLTEEEWEIFRLNYPESQAA